MNKIEEISINSQNNDNRFIQIESRPNELRNDSVKTNDPFQNEWPPIDIPSAGNIPLGDSKICLSRLE